MNIGQLEKVQNDGIEEYWGFIKTLALNLSIKLVQNKKSGGGLNSPDFIILGKSLNGNEAEIGSAWLKTPNDRLSKIEEFISITIDDISFEKSINVAAFFDKETKKYNISWNRPKQISKTA